MPTKKPVLLGTGFRVSIWQHFLLDLYVVAVGVEEVILQHVEIRHGLHLEGFSIFLHPLAANRKQAFRKVGIDERMHLQRDVVLVLVEEQVFEVVVFVPDVVEA